MAEKTLVDFIAELAVGETYTKAMRCDASKMTIKDVFKTGQKMVNTISTAAARAGKRTGHTYSIERATHITKSLDVMAVVFVTAKGEGE